MKRGILGLVVGAAAALLSGCTVVDVAQLSQDRLKGRDNGTPGSALARAYLIEQLEPIARGLNTSASGDAPARSPPSRRSAMPRASSRSSRTGPAAVFWKLPASARRTLADCRAA
jgi:hypothetical protein